MQEKKVTVKMDEFVEELKKNPSSRFSKADFQMLVYGVLSDKDFKAKKYLLRNDQILEEEYSIGDAMMKFLDKLLQHAGVNKPGDAPMPVYTECGKNMRMFRSKMLQLTIQKMVRSGRYDGKITYKKKVVDRALELQKRLGDSSD